MTEVALVKVLSAFFGIDSILICHNNEFTDNDVNLWTSMASGIDISLHVFITVNKLSSQIYHEDMTLIYTDDIKCFGEIFYVVGLMSKTVWLAPDYVTAPSAKYLRLDSNWISFSSSYDNDTIELVEHYGALHEKSFSQFFGSFSKETGLVIPEPEIWRRRNNLDGANLINTVNSYPYVNDFVDDHHKLDGLLPELMTSLQRIMNFTVTNVQPPDQEFGIEKEHENGTKYWSGLVGELLAKRADMSIAGLTIKSERGRVIDYTIGVLPETLTLNIGKKSISTSNINTMAFLKSLSPTTWFTFLGFVILYGICYSVIRVAKNRRNDKLNFWDLYGFISVGIVFIGLPVSLGKWLSERMLYMTIFVMCLFLFEGYVANLTAEMTVGKPKVHLKSFQDIIDNEITIFLPKGTVMDQYFAEAQEGTARYIVNKNHLNRDAIKSTPEAAEEIESNPKSAYFESIIDFIQYEHVTPLLDFDGGINAAIGIGLQKNSELKAAFDYHIIQMRQSGLLQEMYNEHIQLDKPGDMSDRIFQDDILILGFDNLFLPANIMTVGVISALVILACEKMFSSNNGQSNDMDTLYLYPRTKHP